MTSESAADELFLTRINDAFDAGDLSEIVIHYKDGTQFCYGSPPATEKGETDG